MSKPNKDTLTCVACRSSKPKGELLRVIGTDEGTLVLDWRGNLGGRGAHICPKKNCVTQSFDSTSLSDALKVSICHPPIEEFIEIIKKSYRHRIATLLHSSVSKRVLAPGNDEANASITANRSALLILAEDFRNKENFLFHAKMSNIPVFIYASKEQLGTLTGRKPTGVLSVCDKNLARSLRAALTAYTGFDEPSI